MNVVSRGRLAGLTLATVLSLSPLSARAADTIIYGHAGAPSAVMWPLYAGIENGFFAAENLAIDMVFARSSASVIQQMASGSLDMGDTGIMDPIRAIDQGAAVAILAINATPSPYALMAKSDIKSVKDLKGRAVAAGDITDIARDYLDRILVGNGMADADIDSIPGTSTPARLAALESGAADAAIVSPPANFRAESRGFVTLALAADYTKDFPFGVITVSRQWASANPSVAKRFLAVEVKSVAWLYDPAHRDAAIRLMAEAGKAEIADVDKSYDFFHNINFFERSAAISKAGLRSVVDLLKERGDVKKSLDVDSLIMPGIATFAPQGG